MANPSVTYTFTNSTTADGTQVSQNFIDLINAMTDGTKSFSIDALTVAGAALFNGAVTLGNASGDDITHTGSLASAIPVKTDNSYDIGDTTHGLRVVHANTFKGSSTAGMAFLGTTDGSAASAGYVGELLSQSTTTNSTADQTSYAIFTTSQTLTAGRWLIVGAGSFALLGPSTSGSSQAQIELINSSDSAILQTLANVGERSVSSDVNSSYAHTWAVSAVVNISASKAFYVRGRAVAAGGATGGGVLSRAGGAIWFVRLP